MTHQRTHRLCTLVPAHCREVGSSKKLGLPAMIGIVCLFCAAAAIAAPAQGVYFTSLATFNGPNGEYPEAALTQGADGDFYGTTFWGGTYGWGAVFKVTSGGTLTLLHSFDQSDGSEPAGWLIEAGGGNFYGTTTFGGNTGCNYGSGCGTVFTMTPSGTLRTLYSFCSQLDCTDGADPSAGLVQGADGNFYGTASGGGAYYLGGTVFRISSDGTLATLYSFCSQPNCADGANPSPGLVLGRDGNFYGVTTYGGNQSCSGSPGTGCGTAFKITPSGTLTTLYTFCTQNGCPDGEWPLGALVQASDGNFYGTTNGGGSYGGGTVFKITAAGVLTTLYNFCSQANCTDGANPTVALVQGSNGNFYGATNYGGAAGSCSYPYAGCGTVFEITPSGTLTTLHSFDVLDGRWPVGGLVQARDGGFYGTTESGGAYNDGTVFRIGVVRTCATCQP